MNHPFPGTGRPGARWMNARVPRVSQFVLIGLPSEALPLAVPRPPCTWRHGAAWRLWFRLSGLASRPLPPQVLTDYFRVIRGLQAFFYCSPILLSSRRGPLLRERSYSKSGGGGTNPYYG